MPPSNYLRKRMRKVKEQLKADAKELRRELEAAKRLMEIHREVFLRSEHRVHQLARELATTEDFLNQLATLKTLPLQTQADCRAAA